MTFPSLFFRASNKNLLGQMLLNLGQRKRPTLKRKCSVVLDRSPCVIYLDITCSLVVVYWS